MFNYTAQFPKCNNLGLVLQNVPFENGNTTYNFEKNLWTFDMDGLFMQYDDRGYHVELNLDPIENFYKKIDKLIAVI